MTDSEVLFLGGRAGAGKSSVANEIHVQLTIAQIQHGLIEGDNLDQAFPPPWEHHLAERNLAAMWGNYRALGYRRLIYTNTVSVLEAAGLAAAMGDSPTVTGVLLTCSDATARRRLGHREIGSALGPHIERSARAARHLDAHAPRWVHSVATDDRSLADIARQVISLTGWTAAQHGNG